MNQFIPVSTFLRKRLARRSFDNVEEFRRPIRCDHQVLQSAHRRAVPKRRYCARSSGPKPGR